MTLSGTKTVELHFFEGALITAPEKLIFKYIDTLKSKKTTDTLGDKYKDKELSDEEILNYYKTLPASDRFFVAYDKKEDKYVGTCRLMNIGVHDAEVGYMTFLSDRGQGYGKAILHAVKSYAYNLLSLRSLRATTYKDNIASINCFKAQKFFLVNQTDTHYKFVHTCDPLGIIQNDF